MDKVEKMNWMKREAQKKGIDHLLANYYFEFGENLYEGALNEEEIKQLKMIQKNGLSTEEVHELLNMDKNGEPYATILKGRIERNDEDENDVVYAEVSSSKSEKKKKTKNNDSHSDKKLSPERAKELFEKSEKAKSLLEKVNKLVAAIENERNPLKRHLACIKVKMLSAKIDRELALLEIKEGKATEREKIKENRESTEKNGLAELTNIGTEARVIKSYIANNSEYDYKSPEFLYGAYLEKGKEGMEELVKKLENSADSNSQEAAKKIKDILDKRRRLKELENNREKYNQEISQGEKEEKKAIRKSNTQEKALVVKQKMNIFGRIHSFFGIVGGQIKKFVQEVAGKTQAMKDFDEKANAAWQDYQTKMEELQKDYDKARDAEKENYGKNSHQAFMTFFKEQYGQELETISSRDEGTEKKHTEQVNEQQSEGQEPADD